MACHADQDCSPAPGQHHAVEAESHHMEASDFRCSICYELLLDPVVGSCGHDFCKRCIDAWQQASLQSGRVVHCPVCRSELVPAAQGGFGVCIRLRETIARLFPAELRQRQEEVALQLQQQQEAEQRRLLEQQQHQQAYMPGSVGQPPPGSALHASFSVFAETYRQLSQQLLSVVATTARGMDPAAAAAAAAAAGAPAVGGGLQMPGTQHLPAWQRHAMLQNSLALLMNPAGPGAAVMGPPGAAPGAAPSHRRRSGGGMTYSTSSSVTSSSTSSSGALAREAAYAAPHAAAQGAQGEAEQQGAPVAHAPQLELAGLPATSQQQQQQQPMDLDMPAAPALLVATSGEPEHGAGSLPGQPATPTAAAAAAAEAAAANLLQQQAMAALAAAATTAHIQQQEAERWAASLLMHSPLAAASMANSWAAPLSVRSEEELIAAHAALQKRLEVCERVMSICGVPMEAPPPSPTAAAAAAAAGWHQGAGGGFAAPQHQHQHQHAHVQQGSHGHAPHQTHSHGHHQQQLQMGWASDAQPASPSFTASDSSAPLAFMNTPGNAGSSQAYPMGSNVDQLLHVQRQQVQAQLWRAHMHQQQQQQQGQAYAVAAAAAAAAGFQLPPGGLAAMQQQMQRGAWSAQGSQRDHHSAGHPTELYAASTRSGMSW